MSFEDGREKRGREGSWVGNAWGYRKGRRYVVETRKLTTSSFFLGFFSTSSPSTRGTRSDTRTCPLTLPLLSELRSETPLPSVSTSSTIYYGCSIGCTRFWRREETKEGREGRRRRPRTKRNHLPTNPFTDILLPSLSFRLTGQCRPLSKTVRFNVVSIPSSSKLELELVPSSLSSRRPLLTFPFLPYLFFLAFSQVRVAKNKASAKAFGKF